MWGNWLCKNIIIYMTRMSFYYLAYCIRKQFVKPMPQKSPVSQPVPPSDKDKEDYKEEFEPNPDYGRDF